MISQHPPSDRTWEPIDNVFNAQALVGDFHHRYPYKPGPTLLIDWLGYPLSDRTKEPVDNVCSAQALVDNIHCRYPLAVLEEGIVASNE